MATLIILLCSYGEELYQIGHLYLRTGDTYKECVRSIVEQREARQKPQVYPSLSHDSSQRLFDSIDGFLMCRKKNIKNTLSDTERIASKLVFINCHVNEITEGTSFLITGQLYKYSERFSINLIFQRPNGEADIALHINPRLPQNYIVRNSVTKGEWGKEEVTSAFPFALKRGQPFSIEILVTESEYQIATNGYHFCVYSHRVPFRRINCIEVKGDVYEVQAEQRVVDDYPERTYATVGNKIKTVTQHEPENVDVSALKTLPYYAQFTQPFQEGHSLYIIGRVKILPHSFFFNLQDSNTIWPHPTVAFHFNPRFAVAGKHIICRNSWIVGKWGQEERTQAYTDFTPGQQFVLKIQCSAQSYLVFLNNKFILDYKHRINPTIVNTIFLRGDIKIYDIIHETNTDSVIHNSFYNYDLDEEE